jgi:subtilisin-like proprotein convertase family protein
MRARTGAFALLALGLVIAAGTSGATAAKKGKSKSFSESVTVNAGVPDRPAAGATTALTSTISVPKKFKGEVVGDVNVTGIQTTGDAAGAANDLRFTLRSPSGRTVQLFQGIGDQSLGPWTLDDDTPVSVCDNADPLVCFQPFATLLPPFAGTSNMADVSMLGTGSAGTGPLSSFNGDKMRGTWTLSVVDLFNGQSSTLNRWGLELKPAKAVTDGTKKPFTGTTAPNAGVPDVPAAGLPVPLESTLTVPKKYKGRVVGDLNVTGIQTTGSVTDAANDLQALVRAPNGRVVYLFGEIGDQNIGPLTLDDDTSTTICDNVTPTCEDPNATLLQPFAGTANLLALGGVGVGPLSSFDGVKMRGTWTFAVWDDENMGETSVLNQWGLRIKPAKPVTE